MFYKEYINSLYKKAIILFIFRERSIISDNRFYEVHLIILSLIDYLLVIVRITDSRVETIVR